MRRITQTFPGVFGCLGVLFLAAALPASARFQRGDVDASSTREITDGVRILDFLFRGSDPLVCEDAADVDDSGSLDISDAVYVLSYLFRGGPEPPPPFAACGVDPTSDDLDCAAFAPCPAGDFEEVAASFGNIETLAGKGGTQNDNGWRPAFEGGAAEEAELSAPHNALGDDAGNVFIADKEGHGIRKVTPDGKIFTVAGTSAAGDGSDVPGPGTERALRDPNGIWVRGDGTVYILDLGNEKVRRLRPDGQLSTLFTVPGVQIGRGLWVADDEQAAFLSSEDKLVKWTSSAGLEVYATGFGQLGNIVMDPQGNPIVADRGRHRVFRVTQERELVPIAGNELTSGGGDGEPALETGLDQVRGVWLHGTGGLFLATHRGSQVWYVDTGGIIHLFIDGSPGAHDGDGQLYSLPGPKVSEVRSVSMDRRGNLLITENDFGFVRIVFRKSRT